MDALTNGMNRARWQQFVKPPVNVEIKSVDCDAEVKITNEINRINIRIDAISDQISMVIQGLSTRLPETPEKIPIRYLSVGEIIKIVCKYYRVSKNDMHSQCRIPAVCFPRQIACYLCKTTTTKSFPEIGRIIGGRDHSTVIHAFRKIEALRLKDASLCQELMELEQVIASLSCEKVDATIGSNATKIDELQQIHKG